MSDAVKRWGYQNKATQKLSTGEFYKTRKEARDNMGGFVFPQQWKVVRVEISIIGEPSD